MSISPNYYSTVMLYRKNIKIIQFGYKRRLRYRVLVVLM